MKRTALFFALALIACGASFAGDSMATPYSGNPTTAQLGAPVVISTPDGGDAPNAAGVNAPLGTLADYVEALRRRWPLGLTSALERPTGFTAPSAIAVAVFDTASGGASFAAVTDKGAGVAGEVDAMFNGGLAWGAGTFPNPVAQSFTSVAASPAGTLVAVGYGGTIVSATLGGSFLARTSGTTNVLRKVAFANGLFVAVGDSGTLLTSPDGITWTARSGLTGTPTSLDYANGQWLVGKAGGTLTWAADPTNNSWTTGTDARIGTARGVAFGNGTYCAVGDSGTLFGADLATYSTAGWTDPTDDPAGSFGVVFADGWFVTADATGSVSAGQNASNFHPRLQLAPHGTPLVSIAYSATLKSLAFASDTTTYTTMPLW